MDVVVFQWIYSLHEYSYSKTKSSFVLKERKIITALYFFNFVSLHCWGEPYARQGSRPGRSSNTLRHFHAKETGISSSRLSLWLVCAFTFFYTLPFVAKWSFDSNFCNETTRYPRGKSLVKRSLYSSLPNQIQRRYRYCACWCRCLSFR